jgi:hypothetical protein
MTVAVGGADTDLRTPITDNHWFLHGKQRKAGVGEMVQGLSLGVARVMPYERWGSGMPPQFFPKHYLLCKQANSSLSYCQVWSLDRPSSGLQKCHLGHSDISDTSSTFFYIQGPVRKHTYLPTTNLSSLIPTTLRLRQVPPSRKRFDRFLGSLEAADDATFDGHVQDYEELQLDEKTYQLLCDNPSNYLLGHGVWD